jgi:hypothetical protein
MPAQDLGNQLQSMFFRACAFSPLSTVMQFVQQHPNLDVHACDDHALYNACWMGRLPTARYLAQDLGCNIHRQDLVSIAQSKGHVHVVEWLTCAGVVDIPEQL